MRRSNRDLSWLTAVPVAHRGLHDSAAGCPENSCAAVEAAVQAGYAVEVDAQLSADGTLVVFHDDTLHRMTGHNHLVKHTSASSLSTYTLQQTTETIPTLQKILEIIKGRVPLFLELKVKSGPGLTAAKAATEALKNYAGDVAVMSFHTGVGLFMRALAPKIVRGSLRTQYFPYREDADVSRTHALMAESMHALDLERADYIAYDRTYLTKERANALRVFLDQPLLSWTIKSPRQAEDVTAAGADNIIFENFRP